MIDKAIKLTVEQCQRIYDDYDVFTDSVIDEGRADFRIGEILHVRYYDRKIRIVFLPMSKTLVDTRVTNAKNCSTNVRRYFERAQRAVFALDHLPGSDILRDVEYTGRELRGTVWDRRVDWCFDVVNARLLLTSPDLTIDRAYKFFATAVADAVSEINSHLQRVRDYETRINAVCAAIGAGAAIESIDPPKRATIDANGVKIEFNGRIVTVGGRLFGKNWDPEDIAEQIDVYV